MPQKRQIKVGDSVRFRFGVRMVDGIVKEDRGPIGVKGRHLYLVYFDENAGQASQIELPADEMQVLGDGISKG